MKIKRILSGLLALTMLCALLVVPTSAAGQSTFTDITDAATAQSAEMLRLLGIVNGTGSGLFEPNRPLTRAEFCKMAVELMDNGDKVAAQMNRTVFQDVPSTHWARGYIAVATQSTSSGSGETAVVVAGIIRGDATGRFHPDRPITYAEAVTILMRILGYQDADLGIGSTWYDGYLKMAATRGLADGVTATAEENLTRGQVAILMHNLVFIEPKDSKDLYLKTLGGTISDEVLIFAVDATAPDGSANAIKTMDKLYKTDRAPFADDLVGRRAKLVLDKDEKVLDIQMSDKGTQRTVHLVPGEYNALKTSTGESIKVDPKIKVWQNGEETSYDKLWQKLRTGTQARLQYSSAGELEYIFLMNADVKSTATAMVAKSTGSGNPFGSLTGSQTGYAIYKNGVPATAGDIRQYDVATFDKGASVLYVSDRRLTGVFENAYPSPENPAAITLMNHSFPVLDSAITDLASFKIGDVVTILLTHDSQVAGVVSTDVAKSTTVGTVKVDRESGAATVTPIMELLDKDGTQIVLSGDTSYKVNSADQMQGQLVVVSSVQKGKLNLTRLTSAESGVAGKLDMNSGKVGDTTLADDVMLYERVGTSIPAPIERKDITVNTVAAKQILYVHTNYAGKADIVVLDSVTGDQYTYGLLKYTAGFSGEGMGNFKNPEISVTNAGAGAGPFVLGDRLPNKTYGGILPSLSSLEGSPRLASSVLLTAIKEVKSSAFDTEARTVSVAGAVYPISKNVQCFNKTTNTWFTLPASATTDDCMDALDKARAFSTTLTVYVDKDPNQGGKVRIVVVE